MNIREYALRILNGSNLEEKLLSPALVTELKNSQIDCNWSELKRPSGLGFTGIRDSFPKKQSFHQAKNRGKAFHFFANHELLAIEIMALTLVRVAMPEDIAAKILKTIGDEQKHFRNYLVRMQELGVEFGEFSLNDFFWKYATRIKSLEDYFSQMSLTFENANLDFATSYLEIFQEYGDFESAAIVQEVLEDEIHHVSLGATYLKLTKPPESDLWSYYTSLLPSDLSPSRGKGVVLYPDPRLKAGLTEDFIQRLDAYRGPLNQLNRKEWK
jgi:uncharacterized ferritin-like protein (DUF455 family)